MFELYTMVTEFISQISIIIAVVGAYVVIGLGRA